VRHGPGHAHLAIGAVAMFIATGAIGTKKPLVSFRGSLFSDTINTRSYSTTIDLGAAHPSRLIVVGTACVTTATEQPTACTVDGASAALAIGNSPALAVGIPQQLWYVARPTGGSVTVDFSKPGGGDMDRGSLAVWSVYYLRSHAPRATNADATLSNPSTVPLTVLANSAVFGVAAQANGSNLTWTLTGLTDDASDGVNPFQSAFGSAQETAAGSRTIEFASSLGLSVAVSAYWR
jgi:hypothetical protein